jgi:hypothetical protein
MQFSFSEIQLMLDENRQETWDATPSPLAGRTATTRGDEHQLAELRALIAAQMLENPFGDIVLDDAQEEARLKRAAERMEQLRIHRAWREKCESIAVRKTRLRVNDSDWANYRDQLSRRQQRKGTGRSNPAKEPAVWDLFEDDPPKFPRSMRKAKARAAAVEEWLAGDMPESEFNPFD